MKSALILGGAACVWEDMEAAQALGHYDATIAINDVLEYYDGEIDYAVSLHPQKYAEWMKERDRKDFSTPKCFVAYTGFHSANAHKIDLIIPFLWPGQAKSGSSGLFAVKVAIDQGFKKIVLCGIPMDLRPHFFSAKEWTASDGFWKAWPAMADHFKTETRSMSGRTQELLGAPTREWLAESRGDGEARWASKR